MSNSKKVFVLKDTIEFTVPVSWKVGRKSEYLIEFTFPIGSYPKLGVSVECFDNPRITSEKEIFKYLTDGIKTNKKIKKISSDVFTINYEINTSDDNLILWKVLNIAKPRNFRFLRLSLGWPNNENANHLVKEMLNDITNVIENIRFSVTKTIFDDLASLDYKLKNNRLENKILFDYFKIRLPVRWHLLKNIEEQNVLINLEKNLIEVFIESINLNWNKEIKDPEKTVMFLIEEMTKNLVLSEQSLKKSEDDFIFSFALYEKGKNNQTMYNHIWYRIKTFKRDIKMVSMVLNFSESIKKEGYIYKKYLNDKVIHSEIK